MKPAYVKRVQPLIEIGSPLVEARMMATALWYEGAGQAQLRTRALPEPHAGEVLVQMLCSGISRGTERLVFCGLVPVAEYQRMRAPFQKGDFPFPVQYGYCAVGRVVTGPPDLVGRNVFALHPHQDWFYIASDALTVLPDDLPPRRATLIANMETALNAVWDSGASPGDRIAIIGGGIIGMLVAALCAKLPGAEVSLADIAPHRAGIAKMLGVHFVNAHDPRSALQDSDIVFHASATAQGLALALASAGTEARVVELSWYGDHDVAVPLGGAFHSRRLHLAASQVGTIAPSHRARWTFARRLEKVVDLLADPVFDALVTNEISFADSAAAMADLLAVNAPGLATVITYPQH